ncbi:unnamed protein product [Rotaria magnacalcarata]|uniref:Uncharacterized protein n=1 Tax=Rotaria magnacalcarata TaxID=392030 RepID=A0A816TME4_9BILA|nr:unnamed protein product [Rotaria magnacalcarata]CAF2099998.1 unnamed protein product [Rotaria magnacalcarata]CAF4087763.1 unnamed protein product [Rotaria magnacalcarata]CAF4097424.1 unnamed protein product [Rotaria magnacalcarata]
MTSELMEYGDNNNLDHLTLSRVHHLKTRTTRGRSVSDEEIDAVSDWSESDRECCPLSDFESTSNVDGTNLGNHYDITFDDEDDDNDEVDQRLPMEPSFLENVLRLSETPEPKYNDNTISAHISSFHDKMKPQQQQQKHIQERTSNMITRKPSMRNEKQFQSPLLPARRMPSKQVSPRRPTANSYILPQTTTLSRSRKTVTSNSTRYYLQRETTSTSTTLTNQLTIESTSSPNTSFHSNEENHHQQQQQQQYQFHQRHLASPNLSQTSVTNSLIPRAYEVKKIIADDHDYGRLTDLSIIKTVPPRNRQKWGTIVHPPFPLGYQQASPEQVTQSVHRLTSPSRCRDRHTPIATPSKRYLSVEETDALINRLTKVKPIRSTDPYWQVQRQSRPVKNFSNTLKTNNNWKGIGVSA